MGSRPPSEHHAGSMDDSSIPFPPDYFSPSAPPSSTRRTQYSNHLPYLTDTLLCSTSPQGRSTCTSVRNRGKVRCPTLGFAWRDQPVADAPFLPHPGHARICVILDFETRSESRWWKDPRQESEQQHTGHKRRHALDARRDRSTHPRRKPLNTHLGLVSAHPGCRPSG